MEFVTSNDGTTISYECSGAGPPLVLVHGSLNDRNIWSLVLAAFQECFTVYRMDRRGRGESGPPADHALERQFEDVAAVIGAAGEPVDLVGHSYGAHCALGAAAMVPTMVKHLVLYEHPRPTWHGWTSLKPSPRVTPPTPSSRSCGESRSAMSNCQCYRRARSGSIS